ncbi:hypothetical protein HC823_01455 [Candidatus Gracilibacteria bacterium]|nr:hypothetical protein [Candidatus Gracilibacteria bacterium]
MKDIEEGNKKMGKGQVMIVSVNGTPGLEERGLLRIMDMSPLWQKKQGQRLLK